MGTRDYLHGSLLGTTPSKCGTIKSTPKNCFWETFYVCQPLGGWNYCGELLCILIWRETNITCLTCKEVERLN